MAWDRVRNTTRVLRHDVQTALPRVNPRKQVYMFFLFLACFCSVTSQYRELINQVWFSFPDRIYSTTASGDEQIIQTTETRAVVSLSSEPCAASDKVKFMEIYGSKGEILGEGGGGDRERTIFFARASVFSSLPLAPHARSAYIFTQR